MEYIVKQGDTVSKIARDVLGNMDLWPEIAAMNQLANPDLIYPGQVLNLPLPKNIPAAHAAFGWLELLIIAGIGFVIYREHKKKKVKK